MSIKRTSKSTGTSARKPTASPVARHVDVMAPAQMHPGEIYSGWLCKNKSCGRVIAIASKPAGGKTPADSDDQLIVIKCPHCADENLYRWSNRGKHPSTA